MSKYHNRKTTLPTGETFDSQREALRYIDLAILVKAGYITDLKRQTKFTLIPNTSQTSPTPTPAPESISSRT